MGRKQTIDRGSLLDAAERVVLRQGAGQLTMDAVAAEAGVSKGGVLYAFASKDALIDAMFVRAFEAFDQIAETVIAEAGESAENRVRGHVLASRDADQAALERSIALTVNFIRSPQYRRGAVDYYRGILDRLDVSTLAGRKARLALLACEGALLLRGFELSEMTEAEWRDIHADILELLI